MRSGFKLVLNSRIWVVAGSVWTSEFYRGDTLVLNCSFLSIINQFSKPKYNLDSKPRYLGIVGCRRNWEYLTLRIFGYWESGSVQAVSNRLEKIILFVVQNISCSFYLNPATSILVTDNGDELSSRQLWDVGDCSRRFRHQHPLYFNKSVEYEYS